MKAFLTLISLTLVSLSTFARDVVCTPTINSVTQTRFVVNQQINNSDISELEQMLQDFHYGDLTFRIAIDTTGNYRIRCNQEKPYTELLIAQGRMPKNDGLFIYFDANTAGGVRLDCITRSNLPL